MKSRLRIALVTTLTGLALIGGIHLQFVASVQEELMQLVQRSERQARMLSVSTKGALETPASSLNLTGLGSFESDVSPQDAVSCRRPLSELRPGLFESARKHGNAKQTMSFQGAQVLGAQLVEVPWVLITGRADWRIYRAAALDALSLIAFLIFMRSGI